MQSQTIFIIVRGYRENFSIFTLKCTYVPTNIFREKAIQHICVLFKSLKKVAAGLWMYIFSFYSIWELLFLVFQDWHRNFWDLICFLDFQGDNFLWPQQE